MLNKLRKMGKPSWEPPSQNAAGINKFCCNDQLFREVMKNIGSSVHQHPRTMHVNLSKLNSYVWRNFPLWKKNNMLN